jgi:hypothetical protein
MAYSSILPKVGRAKKQDMWILSPVSKFILSRVFSIHASLIYYPSYDFHSTRYRSCETRQLTAPVSTRFYVQITLLHLPLPILGAASITSPVGHMPTDFGRAHQIWRWRFIFRSTIPFRLSSQYPMRYLRTSLRRHPGYPVPLLEILSVLCHYDARKPIINLPEWTLR